jgi:hypothetical protein
MSEEEQIPEDNLKEQPIDSDKEFEHENIPEHQNTADLQPTIPTSEIKDMEVHHHTHPPHGKKTWKDYFWEFLMLFLAVFCGFLAEYQLEHQIEKDREKQYMKSMVEDLKADTTMLIRNIKQRQSRIMMTDSLVILLGSPSVNERGNEIYYFGRSISPPTNIFPNDGTIQQLKSSGNLRLIRNSTISNSIMAYDQKMRNVLFEMGDEVEVRAEYRFVARKLFQTKVFYEMITSDEIRIPKNNPALYSKDAGLLNEFIGAIQYFKRIHQAQLIRSEELLVLARKLMENIIKEYHLE